MTAILGATGPISFLKFGDFDLPEVSVRRLPGQALDLGDSSFKVGSPFGLSGPGPLPLVSPLVSSIAPSFDPVGDMPSSFKKTEPVLLNLRSSPGPMLNLGVPSLLSLTPEPVVRSFGQVVADKGLLGAADGWLESIARSAKDWTGSLTRSIDVQRDLAAINAQDPALPPGVAFGYKGEAAVLTAARFGSGIISNLFANYVDGGRTLTNDGIRTQAFQNALMVPIHPVDVVDGVVTGVKQWAQTPGSTEDKLTELVSSFVPNPGTLGKAALFLGTLDGWKANHRGQYMLGITPKTGPEVTEWLPDALQRPTGGGLGIDTQGPFVFNTKTSELIYSPSGIKHFELSVEAGVPLKDLLGGVMEANFHSRHKKADFTVLLPENYRASNGKSLDMPGGEWTPETVKQFGDFLKSKGYDVAD